MQWKFTNIHHSFRRQAGISLNEYAVLDIIYQSQTNPKFRTSDGWADSSYAAISTFLGLSKGSVHKIVERMVETGLLEVDPANPARKRTTAIWYENAYLDNEKDVEKDAEIIRVQKMNAVQKVNDTVQKVNGERSKSERHRSKSERNKRNKEVTLKKYKERAENTVSAPFDESDIEDFETQIENDAAPITIIVEEEETALPKSRKSSKKTLMGGGAFFKARQVYDEAYRNWMRKTGAGVDSQDGIYWNKKEIGSLSNLLKAIRSKATAKGKIYPSDLDFVENAFADFIQTAANLQVWYLNDFSPSNLNSKFNALYADVVVYFKTGKNNGHGTTQHKNGRNGHQFNPARTAYMESLLDT